MNYQESLEHLRRLGNEVLTMRFGLDSIRGLLAALGDPHLGYPCVIVAGTNGKGSVAHLLHSILCRAGIRSALYTSPHVLEPTERMRLGPDDIPRREFADSLTRVVEALSRCQLAQPPTLFDRLTAAALDWFARKEAEIAVLEVGMGGRLDSTNAVEPILSIITPIGLDHQRFLGNSLSEIAGEKAGIMRPGVPCLSTHQAPEARHALRRKALQAGTQVEEVGQGDLTPLSSTAEGRYKFRFKGLELVCGPLGRHQVENAALAAQAARLLVRQGWPIRDSHIAQGVASARIRGRLERVGRNPAIFLDGCHNPHAAERLAEFVQEHTSSPRAMILGMYGDKDLEGMAQRLVPAFSHIVLLPAPSQRAASEEELKRAFPMAQAAADFDQALRMTGGKASTIVACGSFGIVAQAYSHFAL